MRTTQRKALKVLAEEALTGNIKYIIWFLHLANVYRGFRRQDCGGFKDKRGPCLQGAFPSDGTRRTIHSTRNTARASSANHRGAPAAPEPIPGTTLHLAGSCAALLFPQPLPPGWDTLRYREREAPLCQPGDPLTPACTHQPST